MDSLADSDEPRCPAHSEQSEYSLSMAKVELDRAWSPNGWVTVACWIYALQYFAGVIFCADYKYKSFGVIKRGPPCEYGRKKIPRTQVKDPVVHVRLW